MTDLILLDGSARLYRSPALHFIMAEAAAAGELRTFRIKWRGRRCNLPNVLLAGAFMSLGCRRRSDRRTEHNESGKRNFSGDRHYRFSCLASRRTRPRNAHLYSRRQHQFRITPPPRYSTGNTARAKARHADNANLRA